MKVQYLAAQSKPTIDVMDGGMAKRTNHTGLIQSVDLCPPVPLWRSQGLDNIPKVRKLFPATLSQYKSILNSKALSTHGHSLTIGTQSESRLCKTFNRKNPRHTQGVEIDVPEGKRRWKATP